MRILDTSNRLYILLDAFLIEIFPLYSVVFARSYYGGPLLGVVLAVARECEPLSFDVCLPCDAGISGGFSGCFSGFFLVGFGLFGPGAARAPVLSASLLKTSFKSIYFYRIFSSLTIYIRISKNKYPISLFLVLKVVYIAYTHHSSYI